MKNENQHEISETVENPRVLTFWARKNCFLVDRTYTRQNARISHSINVKSHLLIRITLYKNIALYSLHSLVWATFELVSLINYYVQFKNCSFNWLQNCSLQREERLLNTIVFYVTSAWSLAFCITQTIYIPELHTT